MSRILLWSGVAVTLGLMVALLVSYGMGRAFHTPFPRNHKLHGGLILLMTLPPVGAALLHSHTEKTALSEHVKQYGRMSGLFTNAEEQLSKVLRSDDRRDGRLNVKDTEFVRELIIELGKEALEENGDWVLLHRERPVDPPHTA